MASSASQLRIGLIIPSSNRLTEPQFHRYAPPGVAVHVTRLRMTGPHYVPLHTLLPRIVEAAELLADACCEVVVFHCTASSMEAGLDADQEVLEAIHRATGRRAASTASALLEALHAVAAQRIVLITPYVHATHQHEVDFLTHAGLEVVRDRFLDLPGSDAYVAAPASQWLQTALEERDARADAYVLGCTNIRSVDVIEDIETSLDRPVVTSNQAVLWHALRVGGFADVVPGLGRLFRVQSSKFEVQNSGLKGGAAHLGFEP